MGDEQEGRKHVLRQVPGNRPNRWKPCIIPDEKTGLGHRKAATEFREITGRAGQTMPAAADLKILKQHSDGAIAAVGIVQTRKSVVEGKREAVRVDRGGRRNIK